MITKNILTKKIFLNLGFQFSFLLFTLLYGFTTAYSNPPLTTQHSSGQSFFNASKVVSINRNLLTLTLPNGATREINTAKQSIVENIHITISDIKHSDSLMVIGKAESGDERAIVATLLIKTQEFDNVRPKVNRQNNTNTRIRGQVVSINPIRIKTPSGKEVLITTSYNTKFLLETVIHPSMLQPGDLVRAFPGKIILLKRDNDVKGIRQNTNQPRKEPDVTFPVAPEVGVSFFDQSEARKNKESPFGVFDPNMLRFHHLSWYPEYMTVMNNLGVKWGLYGATFSFNWNLIQGSGKKGEFNWSRHDSLVKYTQSNNVHMIGILIAAEPGFSKGQHKNRAHPLPQNMAEYRNFVRAVVDRYNGDGINDMPGLKYPIEYWLIENEPLSPKMFNGTGADYAVILHAAYETIKSFSPDTKVICSMIRCTGWIKADKNNACSFMTDFFKQLSLLTTTRPYDFIDQHWLGVSPEQTLVDQFIVFKEWLDSIDNESKKYGFPPSPFFCLEVSGSTKSERLQAEDLIKRHIYLLALGVKKVFRSGLKAAPIEMLNERQRNDYFRNVAIITGDNKKKLAYYSYKLLIEILDGADLKETETIRSDKGVFVYKFINKNKPIWVLWDDTNRDSTVTISLPKNLHTVKIIKAIPEGENNFGQLDSTNSVSTEDKKNTSNSLELTIDSTPRFVVGI